MDLFELTYCCRLYRQLSDDDSKLNDLRRKLGQAPDLTDSAHRDAVLVWLRTWGCRQFAIDYNEMSSASLLAWWGEWGARLPAPDAQLLDLSPLELDIVADAYADLCEREASLRGPYKVKDTVRFGPAGASKTLYLLRPHALTPWDRAIQDYLWTNYSVTSYRMFLEHVLSELTTLAQRTGVAVTALPERVGRPQSGAPKLIDEYYVMITRGCLPPTKEELKAWCALADGS